jgi:hypothetical protein
MIRAGGRAQDLFIAQGENLISRVSPASMESSEMRAEIAGEMRPGQSEYP